MKKELKNQNKPKVQKTRTEIAGFIRRAISESRSLTKDIIRDRHIPPSELSVRKKLLYGNEVL